MPRAILFIAVAVSLVLMASVYRNLSPTWDEPSHIGNGLAWLTPPHHLIDPVDPPVGRVSAAVGPWLSGARALDLPNPYDVGNIALRESGHYWRTLTLARLGILPWYLLAVYLVWSMTKRWLGEWPALAAALLFLFCPPVLANATIATTEMPFMAAFLLAIDRIWRALQEPEWRNYAWAGFGVGLACGAKLSGVPFCLLCALVMVAWHGWTKRKLPRISAVAFAALIMFLTIWGIYRFQVGPLATNPASHIHVQRLAAKTGPLAPVVMGAVDHIPAYQFIQGIRVARGFTKHPPQGYLFGEVYTHGRWYFFFFMLLAKTPIPLLIFGLAGLWLALRRGMARTDPFVIVPLAGFFVPMLVATVSHVHLGIRHVLVVYAFLAMLSGLAVQRLYAMRSGVSTSFRAGAVGLLMAANVLACVVAAPDFLAWYNEAAAPWATLIHVDSDYDWGQDLERLSRTLETLPVKHIWISYSGSVELNQFHLPPWEPLPAGIPEKGWIAISETNLRTQPQAFGWLKSYQPVAIAGKTIRIYHIE
ncbi:ArnT family glycosyltransferase [Silvibacterium dinghuense]|uniref:ArnT family glycosyltransferase n=1 Tax=Silvibacterium dinghuense TaxID=1560006 RepID=UPI0013E98E8D|nr:glycosyltransferase family 39 protein [Silvibacterium dinghuense]